MKIPRSAILLFLSFFSAISQAADSPALSAFRKTFLTERDAVTFQVAGDLNGDGLSDVALLVMKDRGQLTQQLYVLLQDPSGGYAVADKSTESPFFAGGCCYVDGMEVRNSSIYVNNFFKDSTGGAGTTINQFKLYKGAWRLVGMSTFYHPGDTGDDTRTDMNLLTGSVIVTTQAGVHRRVIKTYKMKTTPHYLRNFDFDASFGLTERK